MIWISLFLAIIPILIYLFILWWLDKYEREPFQFLLIHFLWGMTGAIILSGIFSYFINFILINRFISKETADFFATIVTAPFVEEAAKGIFLIFTIKKNNFDNLTDGIVYGGAIGLGFGMVENFLYFINSSNDIFNLIYLALIRNLFSVSTHFIATATFGVFVAISKFKSVNSKIISVISGYVIAVGIHLIWNFTVSFQLTFLLGILFVLIALILIFALIQFSLSFEKNILAYEMNDEILNGYLNSKFASIIPNYKQRNSKGWIDERFRKDYIKFATKLAFKKNQLKNIEDVKLKNIYENEIAELREKLIEYENASENILKLI